MQCMVFNKNWAIIKGQAKIFWNKNNKYKLKTIVSKITIKNKDNEDKNNNNII